MRVWIGALLAALMMCFVAACGTAGPAPGAAAAPDSGVALAEVSLKDYQLGAADKLKITVFKEADLTGEYVVGQSGAVSFPLVGEVKAQGLTANQFSQNLTEALKRYIRAPNVSVEVLNYRPFFILGEVKDAGTYPYAAGLTVMDAVATAGGFSYRADTRRVYIKHANETGEREYRLTSTTPVQPGDNVRIPERRF